MYDMWTTLVSYKQTNVVHENKLKIFFKNVTICGSHLTKNWTTFCLSIFIKVVSLERQKIGLTTSELWTTLISCKRKNVVLWKSVISECHNLWFTSKQKRKPLSLKVSLKKWYCWKGKILDFERLEYEPHLIFLLWNEFGSLKMCTSLRTWPFVIHIKTLKLAHDGEYGKGNKIYTETQNCFLLHDENTYHMLNLPDNYFF